MTKKERLAFDKQLAEIASDADWIACDIFTSISLPLEIEALEKVIDRLQVKLGVKKNMLKRITNKEK